MAAIEYKMNSGFYVVIVGPDGAGKTSIFDALTGDPVRGSEIFETSSVMDRLNQLFKFVCFTGEPTQSVHGQAAREMLKGRQPFDQDKLLELFIADREMHMDFVEKMLSGGFGTKPGEMLVLQDRGKYCNAAYQGRDSQHALEILKMNERFRDPNLIIYLDLPAEKCLERVNERSRQEDKGLEVFDSLDNIQRVIDNYGAVLNASGVKVYKIDASKSREEVLADVVDAIVTNAKW